MKKPVAKDFNTDHGMHAAMQEWANSKSKKGLTVHVLFSDGPDVYIDNFVRGIKDVSYKTTDGKTYTVQVDMWQYVNTFMPGPDLMTREELIEAFNKWIEPINEDVEIVSIKWINK